MTAPRLLLFVLTALVGIGALYFFAIEVAAAGIALLIVLLLCVGGYVAFRARRR
jgi:hypothetical protein